MEEHPKICDECGRRYPLSRTVCLDCDESLDSATYGRACLAALAGGAALEGGLLVAGARAFEGWGPFAGHAFRTCVILLLLGYPVFKGVQHLRQPERPLLRELGSAFSDRFNRVLLMLLSGYLVYMAFQGLSLPLTPEDSTAVGWYDVVRRWLLVLAAPGLTGLLVLDQGLGFFDLRRPNTYSRREQAMQTH